MLNSKYIFLSGAKTGKILAVLAVLICLFGFGYNPVQAQPNLKNAFSGDKSPLKEVAGSDGSGYKDVEGSELANTLVSDIISTILSFLGIIFIILMIYGGYMWMMARGNDQQVEKARNLIVAAIIGLIIVVVAYAVSYFIISKFAASTLKT